ncbi:hypothetical protein M9H77_14146 [Catharanthus roseus]|uniref:Uncharacterized protein n=1 Tax=Catharanthus roseus TaxID=4058 RepID=A0ACC0BMH3_CATRO|nr:hypothetical protein M9H77_14146 [Catharanthus roseus]
MERERVDRQLYVGDEKKVKPSNWEQTGLAKGGPVDPELIPSYGGHVAGPIWHGHDRCSLKFRSRYMALTGWELTNAHTSLSPRVRVACYLQHILGSLLFSGKSDNIVPARLWPLLQDVSSVGRRGYICTFRCLHPRLDRVLKPASPTSSNFQCQGIRMRINYWIFYIPAHPIQPQEARRLPNNRMYVLRNTFVEALWFEPFHRVPARMITWVESREYSQWLSLTGSSCYATPGSIGFDCT